MREVFGPVGNRYSQVVIVRELNTGPPQVIDQRMLAEPGIVAAAKLGEFPIFSHAAPSGRTIYRAPEHGVTFVQKYIDEQQLRPHRLQERTDFVSGSPPQFLRALPALFVADVRHGPYAESIRFHPDRPAPRVLINGDSHIWNFGAFAGRNGETVFGSNDHDQSGFGSPEEDIARLTASAVLQARELGFTEVDQQFLAIATVDAYTDEIRRIAERVKAKKPLPPPYLTLKELKKSADRVENDLVAGLLKDTPKRKAKFQSGYIMRDGDTWRLRVDPNREENNPPAEGYHRKLWPVTGEQAENVNTMSRLAITRPGRGIKFPLHLLDVAEKYEAGGSTRGLTRGYGLFEAEDPNMPPLVLEGKELLPCAAQTLSGNLLYADGQGVLDRQREAEQNFNPLTGVVVLENSTFLFREREPEKGSVDFAKLHAKGKITFDQLLQYAQDCSTVRARQHARTGDLAVELSTWIGAKNEDEQAEQRVGAFAFVYTDQTHEDHRVFSMTKHSIINTTS